MFCVKTLISVLKKNIDMYIRHTIRKADVSPVSLDSYVNFGLFRHRKRNNLEKRPKKVVISAYSIGWLRLIPLRNILLRSWFGILMMTFMAGLHFVYYSQLLWLCNEITSFMCFWICHNFDQTSKNYLQLSSSIHCVCTSMYGKSARFPV